MVDRRVQPKRSCLRTLVASTFIVVGVWLGLADIGARWLAPGTDPIGDFSNVWPPHYADSELAAVFDKYDAVFVGTVIGFNEPDNPGLLGWLPGRRGWLLSRETYYYAETDWNNSLHGVVFRVKVAWKGVRQSEIAMPTGFSDSGHRCAGRHFDAGTSYLVYAKRITHPVTYTGSESFATSLCDPIAPFPYKYDPAQQRVYDLPDGMPDLNLNVVGDGYIPSEPVSLLRSQPPLVLVVAGVLTLAGLLIVLWPRIMSIFQKQAIGGGTEHGALDTQ